VELPKFSNLGGATSKRRGRTPKDAPAAKIKLSKRRKILWSEVKKCTVACCLIFKQCSGSGIVWPLAGVDEGG